MRQNMTQDKRMGLGVRIVEICLEHRVRVGPWNVREAHQTRAGVSINMQDLGVLSKTLHML